MPQPSSPHGGALVRRASTGTGALIALAASRALGERGESVAVVLDPAPDKLEPDVCLPLVRRHWRKLAAAALFCMALLLSAAGGAFGDQGAAWARRLGGTSSLPLEVAALPSLHGLRAEELPPSAGCSAFAHVDLLQLDVSYVRLTSADGEVSSASWASGRSVTLSPGGPALPLSAALHRPGPLAALQLRLTHRWRVQAFCHTAGMFLYTTKEGTAWLHSPPRVLPADYAPFQYDAIPGAAPAGALAAAAWLANASAAPGGGLRLLLDTAYAVGCYDGSTTRVHFADAYGPEARLVAGLGQDAPGRPFDWSRAQFGFSPPALPLFAQPASAKAAPVAETYAFASNETLLPSPGGPAVDWSLLWLLTATWESGAFDSNLLDVRVRPASADPRAALGVPGPFFDPAPDYPGAGSWTLRNGALRPGGAAGHLTQRLFIGFARAAAGDYSRRGAVLESDGPDCGRAGGSCLGGRASLTHLYVQLPRATSVYSAL